MACLLQVEGLLSVLSWLEHARQHSLAGSKALIMQVRHVGQSLQYSFKFTHIIL